MQHLLARSVWDSDGVRDELRRYVAGRLSAAGEEALLVVDETGDRRKGLLDPQSQRLFECLVDHMRTEFVLDALTIAVKAREGTRAIAGLRVT